LSGAEGDGKCQWADKEELGSDALNCVQFVATFFIIGRHLRSFVDFPNELGWRAWPNAFVMPAFAFAVGVCREETPVAFPWRAQVATALASIVALSGHVVAIALFSESPFSTHRIFHDRAMFYWFLVNVVIWKMLVTPTFSAAKRFGVPLLIPFSLLFVACYFGRHYFHSIWDSTMSVPSVYVWNRLFAFAPFFATGNLLSGPEWRRIVADWRFQSVGALFFIVWHFLLGVTPTHMDWYVAACPHDHSCEYHALSGHFPFEGLYRPYSSTGFARDSRIYVTMVIVAL
jgi:hypothetical protein